MIMSVTRNYQLISELLPCIDVDHKNKSVYDQKVYKSAFIALSLFSLFDNEALGELIWVMSTIDI